MQRYKKIEQIHFYEEKDKLRVSYKIERRCTLNGWWRHPTNKPFGSNNDRLDVLAPSNVKRLQSCAAGAFLEKNMIKEKRFLLLKTVKNDRLMYITSIAAESRIEAMKKFPKFLGHHIRYGFGFWQYYVSGIQWVWTPYRKKASVDRQTFVQLEMFTGGAD